MTNPKITIIIPVYNVEGYLKRSMESLINQTLRDIEIIVINDGSTDNSLSILKEYAKQDDRIKLINLDKNSGAAVARNKGLEIAKGEYLGFVDPDDEVEKCFYEKLYEKAVQTNAEVVKGLSKRVEVDGHITYSRINQKIKKCGNLYFGSDWQTAIYKSSLIFDNNIIFPPELIKAQDVAFLLKVMLKTTKPIKFVNDVYYILYRRLGSLNADFIPLKNIQSAINSAICQCTDLNDSNLYRKDKTVYLDLYSERINIILRTTLFQNSEFECKSLCANGIIKLYDMCLDKTGVEKYIRNKKLLSLIKSGNIDSLAEFLCKYNSPDNQDLTNTFIENVFSIKNSAKKNYKIVTVLGKKVKLKINKIKGV